MQSIIYNNIVEQCIRELTYKKMFDQLLNLLCKFIL